MYVRVSQDILVMDALKQRVFRNVNMVVLVLHQTLVRVLLVGSIQIVQPLFASKLVAMEVIVQALTCVAVQLIGVVLIAGFLFASKNVIMVVGV